MKTFFDINKSIKGFTLVELLVTISILGILSSIALVVYTGEQKYARMAKRAGDLKAIATALETYRAANGRYPCVYFTGPSSCPNSAASGWRSQCANYGNHPSDQVIPGLVPNYLQNFPSDPKMDAVNSKYCYAYNSNPNGTEYKVMTINATGEMTDADFATRPELVDPRHDGASGDTATNCDTPKDGNITAWSVYTLGLRCY